MYVLTRVKCGVTLCVETHQELHTALAAAESLNKSEPDSCARVQFVAAHCDGEEMRSHIARDADGYAREDDGRYFTNEEVAFRQQFARK